MKSKQMAQCILHRAGVTLIFGVAGCSSLQDGLSKTVYMDYDQVYNFQTYSFQLPNALSKMAETNGDAIPFQYGIANLKAEINGFFAVFVVCNVRNEASKSQTFPYDVHNFFVEYDGKKHFYGPLKPKTYSDLSLQFGGQPAINSFVTDVLYGEINQGPEMDTFPKGYYPTVNYRFAIFVSKDSPGPYPPLSEPLKLQYEGYPNVMAPRNLPPKYTENDYNWPVKKSNIDTSCRQ